MGAFALFALFYMEQHSITAVLMSLSGQIHAVYFIAAVKVSS